MTNTSLTSTICDKRTHNEHDIDISGERAFRRGTKVHFDILFFELHQRLAVVLPNFIVMNTAFVVKVIPLIVLIVTALKALKGSKQATGQVV